MSRRVGGGGRKEKHPTPHIALNTEGLMGVWAICELGGREESEQIVQLLFCLYCLYWQTWVCSNQQTKIRNRICAICKVHSSCNCCEASVPHTQYLTLCHPAYFTGNGILLATVW